jgi:ribosomal protein L32E
VRSDPYVAKSVKQRILVCKELANIGAAHDIAAIARRLGAKKERKMLDEDKERGLGGFFKRLLGQL